MNMMRTFATVAFIVAAVGSSQSSNAQTGAAPQKPPQADVCWQNAATGQPVPKENLVPNGTRQDPTDPDHASQAFLNNPGGNAATGAVAPATNNYVRGADGSWSDAATGQAVEGGKQDCEQIKQDIQDLQDALVALTAQLDATQKTLDMVAQDIQKAQGAIRLSQSVGNEAARGKALDALKKLMDTQRKLKNLIEDLQNLIMLTKERINDLLNALGACGPGKNASPQPKPSSTSTSSLPSGSPSGSPFWWQVDGAIGFTQPTGVFPCSAIVAAYSNATSSATCSGKTTPIDFDVGGGIGITPYFGLNFAYNRSSDVTRTASAPSFSFTDSGTFQLQYEDLTARGIVPIHGWFSLYGEGGVAFWQTSGKDVQSGIQITNGMTSTFATTTLYNFSGASPIVGGGFDFRLYKGLRAGVEFEHFQAKDGALDEHNNELKFRMTYRFGSLSGRPTTAN
jgi:hypothetical protein